MVHRNKLSTEEAISLELLIQAFMYYKAVCESSVQIVKNENPVAMAASTVELKI